MRKTSDILWQDAQHQVLFDILDQIRDRQAGPEVLHALQDYTEQHFSLEELYMAELGYPGLDAHRRAHDSFRAEILTALDTGQPGDLQFMDIVGTYLTEWLRRHVFTVDKELEDYILSSGRK